jgi:UDP-GlcNAc:undecaprenyl-phosphate GlcNAc-1-phosphate transferase
MLWVCVALMVLSLGMSAAMTWAARGVGRRVGALDSPGSPGHEKELRAVPNTGGVAIFWSLALPMAAGLGAAWWLDVGAWSGVWGAVAEHLPGVREKTPLALLFLGCLLVLHVVGVVDDRRALPAGLKAAVMVAAGLVMALWGDGTRLLTLTEPWAGGAWLSVLVTVVWFVAVTNAMNFIDNMDGLSAGVGAIAAGCFLAAAALHGQWFVAGMLALLAGALAGFLVFNFPWRKPATIFMGDGGSLVLGFTLAFLTVRTTYYGVTPGGELVAGAWYGVFMPLVVLAVPVYDLVSVTVVRLRTGRKPWVASPHHLSHRLVAYGLSRRDAVAVMYGLTAVTGMSGVVLGSLPAWAACVVAAQLVVLFVTLALVETRLWRARGTLRG